MDVLVKKLKDNAQVPTYATGGSACFDIYACLDSPMVVTIGTKISTGLAFEIPEGHVMLVYSRSGHGFKNGVRLSNCVGVIDSDYRGELMVALTRDDTRDSFIVNTGDRIAQGMIVPTYMVNFVLVDILKETDRGNSGFGSTGQ